MLRFPRPPRALRAWAPWLAFGALLISGCTDDRDAIPLSMDSAETSGAHYAVAPGTAPPEPEFVSSPPFDLDVKVHGSFKPGRPLHLSLATVANVATADGELRLTLPEVASAEDSGWDVVIMPMNKEFRPHLRVRKAFSAGEKVQERTTITIPEPGYYHLIATGQRHATTSDPYASAAPSVSSREFWLWIDEHGGRMTEEYDTTVFAPGTRKQTGPRGSERRVPRVRRGEGDYTISCSLMPDNGVITATRADTSTVVIMSPCPTYPGTNPPPPPSATTTFTVTYADGGAGNALRPLAGARYLWTITSTAGGTIATGNGFTGSNGSIGTIDCQGTTSERRISVQVHTLAEYVNVKRYSQGSELAGSYSGSCGGNIGITANAFMSHLFTNLTKTVEGHRARFSFPPDRINAVLYDDGLTYYDFLKPGGELHIAYAANMIWAEYGVMVAAHEHGHLWQDRKLWQSPDQNGLLRYWSRACKQQHPPESASTLPCAIGEAFADWYAVVVRETDLPTWKNQLETNYYYRNCVNGWSPGRGQVACTDDGSIVQGAVAAFFWDIIDGSTGEPHDNTYRSPQTLADAIRSCRVYLGGWISYTGVDHLIFCIENRFPYRVAIRHPTTGRDTTAFLFPTRATNRQPSAASGYAFEPQSEYFRRMWLVNLYSKRPDIGTAPVFYSVLPPPELEPEPEPPCGGEGQMVCIESTGRRPAL